MVTSGEADYLVPERVWQEFAKGLLEREPARMFEVLEACSLQKQLLPELRERHAPDFVVANGENAAGGVGITPKVADALFADGVDAITLGNHTYRHRDVYEYLDAQPNIVRPAYFQPALVNGNEIVILNKTDLPAHNDWKNFDALQISCATGEGLEELEAEILSRFGKHNFRPENTFAINLRHRDCLRRALEDCDRALKALDEKVSAEYLSVDLNEALRAVGEVIGTVEVEQILDSVFGQFCIGK